MRLVNADVAKVFLNIEACEQIKRMPTVDPVHAVGGCYCRECKYWLGDHVCDLDCNHEMHTSPDDFCSRGKPKRNRR